ncbi:MAG: hypothetical protein AAGF15_06810 [Pseudomonadota bacterium]
MNTTRKQLTSKRATFSALMLAAIATTAFIPTAQADDNTGQTLATPFQEQTAIPEGFHNIKKASSVLKMRQTSTGWLEILVNNGQIVRIRKKHTLKQDGVWYVSTEALEKINRSYAGIRYTNVHPRY